MNPSAEATRSGKRVAIMQSNYIPWKGYFDVINMVDEFILYDDRQYTRRDWRNRNMIKTPQGLHWLTIPVQVKGKFEQRIDETVIDDPTWADRHWKTIAQAYAGAPYFTFYRERIGAIFDGVREARLSDVNRRFLEALCGLLGIDTPLRWSTEYPAVGNRTERLVSLCRLAGATEYLSGPAARAYMEENLFEEAGIALSYMDYTGYPEYPQLHGKFEHGVSVIDLLLNVGPEAPRYMKSFGAAVAAG